MKILGIDPATTSGWAWSDGPPSRENESLVSGVWRLSVHDAEHVGQRMVRLRNFIYEAAENLGFDKIAFEDAGFGAGPGQLQTMAFHNALRGIVLMVAAEYGVPVLPIVPASLKKLATGNGRAKKPEMISAWHRHYGYLPHSGDEADALWALCFAHMDRKPAAKKVKAKRDVPRQMKLLK